MQDTFGAGSYCLQQGLTTVCLWWHLAILINTVLCSPYYQRLHLVLTGAQQMTLFLFGPFAAQVEREAGCSPRQGCFWKL